MWLFQNRECASFLVEADAYEGVKQIAGKVADDIEMVSGSRPQIYSDITETGETVVLFATAGKSRLLEELEETGVLNLSLIKEKREVYGIYLLELDEIGKILSLSLKQVKQMLIIYGSDKRGTIYGMFHLSEMIGVSPLYFWGDAIPVKRDAFWLDKSMELVSKEPSVRYRGFFINDEWPCFGNWTFHHYGGFTAEMYEKVFELLLRLKGNYLWPAMWSSSFALDGPGEKSAKLADLYGVIMGNSHHEPCLRAGEEWDIYRGKESGYGNEWNYVTNKEGLLNYWADGLKRSGKYENIITVGMRGERDSRMEGPQSLKENIEILKDIITEQKALIKKESSVMPPMLLAIYKEVEHYFYGTDEIEGLKNWEGLKDVILMFCEDNFGHMRYLPDETMKEHSGGFGMYFHLDYHGEPVSYEWINSTPLSSIWEQMTIAYEHGIRDVWMVNVGDLKGNEYPLSYFMDLAYDFDCWGSKAINRTRDYTRLWVGKQLGLNFPFFIKLVDDAADVLLKGTALIARHRPEALSSHTYHPYYEREADRVLQETSDLLLKLKKIEQRLPEYSKSAFYSMIYDDLALGLNLIQMQILAGKNEHYAKQGKRVANSYAKMVTACMENERTLIAQANARWNGKWFGMRTGQHVGFQKWNEDGCRYPLRMYVEPFCRPRLVVSRADAPELLLKNYGTLDTMEILDFNNAGVEEVIIELANDGIRSLNCQIKMEECDWLSYEVTNEKVEAQEFLYLYCDRTLLPEEEQICKIEISDGDTTVLLHVHGKKVNTDGVPAMTFFEKKGVISILAEHFAKVEQEESVNISDCQNTLYDERSYAAGILILRDFGLCGSAVKIAKAGVRAALSYYVMAEQEADYIFELWSAPSNPIAPGRGISFSLENKSIESTIQKIEVLPADYKAGEASCKYWAEGVLAQIHKVKATVHLKKGVNELAIGLWDEMLVPEKILIYTDEKSCKPSCMGPEESWYRKP